MPFEFVLGIDGVSVSCQIPVPCTPINFEFKASDSSFLWLTASNQPGLLPHRTITALSFKSPVHPSTLLQFKSDCNVLPPLGQYVVEALHPGASFTSMSALRSWLPPTVALANYGPHYLANLQPHPSPASSVVTIDSGLEIFQEDDGADNESSNEES